MISLKKVRQKDHKRSSSSSKYINACWSAEDLLFGVTEVYITPGIFFLQNMRVFCKGQIQMMPNVSHSRVPSCPNIFRTHPHPPPPPPHKYERAICPAASTCYLLVVASLFEKYYKRLWCSRRKRNGLPECPTLKLYRFSKKLKRSRAYVPSNHTNVSVFG